MAPLIAVALAAAPMLLPVVQRLIRGDASATDIAGDVAKVATQVLGTAEPDAVRAALADPAKAGEFGVQLAQIAADREAEDNRAEEERLRIILADVAGARTQTVALAQAGSRIAWAAPVISMVIVIGFFGVLFVMLRPGDGVWHPQQFTVINVVLGSLTVAFAAVVNYWLGSSAGSARNAEAVRALAQGQGQPAAIATTAPVTVNAPPTARAPMPETPAEDMNTRFGGLQR